MGTGIQIKWNESCSVGIPVFDKQHKRIYELINIFFNQVQSGYSGQKLVDTLSELKNFAEYHFNYEEKIMKENGYAEFSEHKMQHDYFLTELFNLISGILDGIIILNLESVQYIYVWLEKHILETDIRYTEFMIEKGIW